MLLYLIDNTIDGQGPSPRELQAAFARLRSNLDILIEPYSAVSLTRIANVNPTHIVLSGQSHPWNNYSSQSLQGVLDVIHQASQPILGVCGGHQQIALAYGARVDLMARLEPGEGYKGAKRERGYFPVETNQKGVFKHSPSPMTVWHSHYDEVKELPSGFIRTAWNDTCPIQAMQHQTRPVFGVQFHPELFDDDHPDGHRVLETFLELGEAA